MQDLFDELRELLLQDKRFDGDDTAIRKRAVDMALQPDARFLKLLLSSPAFKQHFFTDIDGILVFDKPRFLQFIQGSYTAFEDKIGLIRENGQFITAAGKVVLSWPYKDCILEGGQTKEDAAQREIFWNETLAPEEVSRLLSPKALIHFCRYNKDGAQPAGTISRKDNLLIKGNNLLALYSLKKVYAGAVKLIYIDPPYNTGSGTFQYNDNFSHSTWLTFTKNRLEVARDLLRDDGAIFVQIDYKEVAYLAVLMDEIFGRENFVQLISVKTASPAGFKTINPGPVDVTEYILFYTKKRTSFKFKKSYVAVAYDDNYDLVITNPEDEPQFWKLEPLRDVVCRENGIAVGRTPQQTGKNAREHWGPHWKIIREQLMAAYALEHAGDVVSIRDPHKPAPRLKKMLERSKTERNKIFLYEKEEGAQYGYVMNGGALSFYANKVQEIDGIRTPTELLTDFWRDISWDGIAKEGGVKLKNGKKPERLIKRIIGMATDSPEDIVLDFYLGSGTTAAVAHKMGLHYIGIEQLDYGENDSRVRLQNVINGDTTGISPAVQWKGGGSFVYCELADENHQLTDEEIALNRQFYET